MRKMAADSKCRYQTKNSYYRILMPFKEEDLYNDPCIKIYHDVLYDDEIIKIKKMASKNVSKKFIFAGRHDFRFKISHRQELKKMIFIREPCTKINMKENFVVN